MLAAVVRQHLGEDGPGFGSIAIALHHPVEGTGLPSTPDLTAPCDRYARRMRRLILVANPSASGFTASLHRDVVSVLQTGYVVTPVWPDSAAEARAAAADAADEGYDVVVAMGGDGVAHQVANGLADSETALGVVPAGTTNVLRRILGLPRKPLDAAAAIAGSAGWRGR